MTKQSDIPSDIEFVNPDEIDPCYRVVLWAAPGEGKSVVAASAPAPIVVISADRPRAYMHARKRHGHTVDTLREVRYRGVETLDVVYRYIRDNRDVKTVVIDPVSNIVDQLADVAPPSPRDGGTDYQWVNKKMLGFVKSLRPFDVNVVLIAHEKVNDGKKGDGKMYPALGGMTLINKLLAEMDIVAHIERVPKPTEDDPHAAVWIGQIQPRDNLVTKDGTDALGARRIADLSRWFELASAEAKPEAPDTSDIPFADDYDPEPDVASCECGHSAAAHHALEGECPTEPPVAQLDLVEAGADASP